MAKQSHSGGAPQGNAGVTPPAEEERVLAEGNGQLEQKETEAGTSGASNEQAEGGAGNGTPPPEQPAASGGETQAPPNTGKPEENPPPQPDSGGAPQGNGKGNTTGKKKVKNPGKAGKKLIVGAKLIEFDAEGVVELDEAEAAILLGLKGYEEV